MTPAYGCKADIDGRTSVAIGGKGDMAGMSRNDAHDPKRTLLRYRVDMVRRGSVVEHSHEHIARF